MRHRRHLPTLLAPLTLALALLVHGFAAHADPPTSDVPRAFHVAPTRPAAMTTATAMGSATRTPAASTRRPATQVRSLSRARLPHRALPAYDTRPPAPPSAGEALLWVPRAVLFPLWVVTEYGLRVPIGWVTSNVERHHVFDRINRIIHPVPNLTIAPTLLVDLGLVTSGGIYAAWDRALHPMHQMRVHLSTGGPNYWLVRFEDRMNYAPRAYVGLRADYLERSDWRYYGDGPDTRDTSLRWFNWSRTDVRAYVQHNSLDHVGGEASVGIRSDRFNPDQPRYVDQIGRVVQTTKDVWYGSAHGYLDTRTFANPHGSGARLEGGATYSQDVFSPGSLRWVTTELEGSVYLEVMRPGRVLSLRAWGSMATSLGTLPVQIVDLVTLGGFESMRGWWWGRFRGESAAVFTLSYRYPIWYWLDGSIYVEAGNAFGQNFSGFAPQHLFGSAGLGFRTAVDRDLSFDLLLALGTSRFDEPFRVNAFRLAFGVNRGF